MLIMAAFELGNPLILCIFVISDYRLFHNSLAPRSDDTMRA